MLFIDFEAAASSETGPHRQSNQDAAFTAPWGAAIADGVGGGPSGDLASAALIHRFVSSGPLISADPGELSRRVLGANWDLRAQIEHDQRLKGMSTTFTGLFLAPDGTVLLAHTGDSRAYRLREGILGQQTRDESYVQLLLESGVIDAKDAVHHPQRNLITASLGGDEDDSVHVTQVDVLPGDRWLLCSDGVSDYLPREEIVTILQEASTPAVAADSLVRWAIEIDAADNVTAIVIDIRSVESRADRSSAESPSFFGAASLRFQEQIDDVG